MNLRLATEGARPEIMRLRDGTAVTVRPIHPTDVEGLRRMGARLSERTVYQRFMAPYPNGLPEKTLRFLATVDHHRREALVAVSKGEIVAVARYHARDDDEAEIAVLVEDAWQGRGLGRALTLRLSALAYERGIRLFSGTMLAQNDAARRLLESAFGQVAGKIDHGERAFTVAIGGAVAPPRRLRAG
jgi:GNAT superfamily N-acetyltransferase